MSRIDLTAIGDAAIDFITHVPETFLIEQGFKKGAQTIIDENRAKELNSLLDFEKIGGGCGANVVAVIAALGGKAQFIGKMGMDKEAEIFASGFSPEITFKTQRSSKPSAQIFTFITPDLERTFASFYGAGADLSLEDVPEAIFADSKITYLDGYTLHNKNGFEVFGKAIEFTHKNKGYVAFSPNNIEVIKTLPDKVSAIFEQSEFVFFSDEEACEFTNTISVQDAMVDLGQFTEKTIIITCGEKGSIILSKGHSLDIEAASLAGPIIDLNGAGDAYAGGFLFGLSENLSLSKCGELGALCAASVIIRKGARVAKDLTQLKY